MTKNHKNKKLKSKVSFMDLNSSKNQILKKTSFTNYITKYIKKDNNEAKENAKNDSIGENSKGSDQQSYGYNKKYNVNILNKSKNDDDIIKTSIFNKDFDKRALKRKQTNKTSVNFKIRNFDKRSTCKTINNVRNSKKKNSSK